jgi:hypothetical protein
MNMNPRLFLLLAFVAAGLPLRAADAASAPKPAAPAPTPAPVASTPARSTAAAAPASRTPSSSIAPTASYEAFRTIADRNIFNPNRTGRRERGNDEPTARLDTITFVGTMESDHGRLAFFDGSDSSFRKALRVGESVDKFKVAKIGATSVELEREGKPLAVGLGQQLRRPEGADWNLVGADIAGREREAMAKAADSAKPDPTAAPVIPANASDAVRRLMEARAKQLKQ